MDMKEILCKESKETRCFIMAAVMVFEGYNGIDETTEVHGKMTLDLLGLTKEEIERFPMPKNFAQIVAHLRPISDSEVRHWVICNTYAPVLKSRRRDALRDFRSFCAALGWDAKEIKEEMELTEEIFDIKPIDDGMSSGIGTRPGSGCLSVITLVIVSITFLAFSLL